MNGYHRNMQAADILLEHHVVLAPVRFGQYQGQRIEEVAKTEHSHPLGMVVSTHFRCGKWVKRGLKNGALPFNID